MTLTAPSQRRTLPLLLSHAIMHCAAMAASGNLIDARKGDREAFGRFYDEHVDETIQWFRRRTASDADAADLCADTFEAALRSLKRFDPSRGPEAAWLHGIAQNQLRRWQRRRRVAASPRAMRARIRMATRPTSDAFDMVEFRLDLESQIGPLDAALAHLSADTKQVLWMRVVDELTYAEISAIVGCTEAAARVRVSRALSTLLDEMGAP